MPDLSSRVDIVDVLFEPLNLELNAPFGIARGVQDVARNVLVTLRLSDGSVGLGEAAPFPAFNGETQAGALSALNGVKEELVGKEARRIRHLSALVKEACGQAPSARAALEMALFDALARRAGLSLWEWFGGAELELHSDFTVTTGSADAAWSAARGAAEQGYTALKIKVGGSAAELDSQRVLSVLDAAPDSSLVLDGNAGLSADAAVALVESLGTGRTRIVLFEQPTPADDLGALAEVARRTGLRVAADESVGSLDDLARLVNQRAAGVVNVKLMKCGLVEAEQLIAACRLHGLELMIGGLVESPLAMTVAACLAAGAGGFRFVDLDTPWFMTDAPFLGGVYTGFFQPGAESGAPNSERPAIGPPAPRLVPSAVGPGHGLVQR